MKTVKNLRFGLHLVVMMAMVTYLSVGSFVPVANAGDYTGKLGPGREVNPNMSIVKTVDKDTATHDDLVSYTIEATNDSTAQNTPLDVMLVIDKSGSMGGDPIDDAKEAAKLFIDQLDSSQDWVGVVSFSSSCYWGTDWTTLDSGLTSDFTNAKTAIDGISSGGCTPIGEGIALAASELGSNGRSDPVKPIIIVLSDGKNNSGQDPVTVADSAKTAGIRIISIGLGSGIDEGEMKAIASSDSDYYKAPDSSELAGIYTNILGTLCDIKTLTITDDITDVLVDADLVSTSPTAHQAGNILTWIFPNVGCGETVSATVTVKVSSNKAVDGSVMDNDATVTDEQENSVPAEPVQTAIIVPTPEPTPEPITYNGPSLTIVKDVDAATANAGDTLNYTVAVANVGDQTATNVVVDDVLPKGLIYQDGTTTKQWVFDAIAPGQSETINYVAIIEGNAVSNDYTNIASVSATGLTAVKDDATTVISEKVVVPIILGEEALPSLTVNKTVYTLIANPGQTISYSVLVTNNGDAVAENVVLIDHIAPGLQFTDTAAPTHTWMLGDILPGNSVTTTYDVIVLNDNEPGIYTNTAEVWAVGIDNIYDTAEVEVRTVKVLGEELPVTGGSAMAFAYLIGAGLVVVFSGYVLKLTVVKK